MRFALLLLAAPMLIALATPQPAAAIAPFYNIFKDEYLKNHPDKKYVEAVDKPSDKCFVCHQGKNRKHHNKFGIHLVEPLDKKEDGKKENRDKVVEALKKVLDMHVDPQDDKSETYLDRIKASKWPGGELADLKKEPLEDAAK